MRERITDLLDLLGLLLVATAVGCAAYGAGLFLTLRGGADWVISGAALFASSVVILLGSWWATRPAKPNGRGEQ